MHEVKVSRKYQIVIPREVRNALRIKTGDKMVIVPRGEIAILLRNPKRYSKAVAGIGKGLYPSDYVKIEKESGQ